MGYRFSVITENLGTLTLNGLSNLPAEKVERELLNMRSFLKTRIFRGQSEFPGLPAAILFTLFAVFLHFWGPSPPLLWAQSIEGSPWKRHVIDDSSQGADGVRLLDANRDGLLDIATGWEEGGEIHLCLHPGKDKVKQRWPMIQVGDVDSPEDAVLADLDGDGAVDVISCCEGKTRNLFVHWAPAPPTAYTISSNWLTMAVPAATEKQRWMYSMPMQIDGKNGLDLVAGGKNQEAQIGWFEIPSETRQLDRWKWHSLGKLGWLMSLHRIDMDNDGDDDIVYSDRRGSLRGCRWLENPGPKQVFGKQWTNHLIGGAHAEVMFMEPADLNGDDVKDFVVATKDQGIICLTSRTTSSNQGLTWKETVLPLPELTGTGKAVQVGNLNRDGRLQMIVTCENAKGKHGLFGWQLRFDSTGTPLVESPFTISGSRKGIKYDRLELIDLDLDGDLDVLTCEERDNLGVIWYENSILN